MLIEEKLYALLTSVSPHVYQGSAPANYQTPCVVFTRINSEPTRTLDDEFDTGAFVTFQVDIYSTRILEAKTLARTIRNTLLAWRDDGVEMVAYTTARDFVDSTTETRLYRVMHDYKLFCDD